MEYIYQLGLQNIRDLKKMIEVRVLVGLVSQKETYITQIHTVERKE